MKPICADSDFRPKAKLATIVEPGRGVPEHRRRVDLMQKFSSSCIILGNYRIAVMRTIFSDMLDRVFEVADRSDRKDQIQVFGAPVFFRCWSHLGPQNLSGHSIAPKLNAPLPERTRALWQELAGDLFVNQQRLDSIADGGSLAFGVDHNPFRHAKICRPVHVYRTNPIEVLNYWHTRRRCDRLNQGTTSPRNDQMDIAIKLRHQGDSRPVGAGHKLD